MLHKTFTQLLVVLPINLLNYNKMSAVNLEIVCVMHPQNVLAIQHQFTLTLSRNQTTEDLKYWAIMEYKNQYKQYGNVHCSKMFILLQNAVQYKLQGSKTVGELYDFIREIKPKSIGVRVHFKLNVE